MTTDPRIDMLQGKTIRITCIIELYSGKPEIEVTAKDQRSSYVEKTNNGATTEFESYNRILWMRR